jgi:hypothetical protein
LSRAAEIHGQDVTIDNRDALNLAARAAALRARKLQERLARIIYHAAQRDIRVCLLKGAALEPWVYPGPGFRPMADVDILVEPAVQSRFEHLLGEHGYVQRSERPREFYADHHHSMPFWHRQQAIWIEVHTRLFPEVANVVLADQECFDYSGTNANRLCAPVHVLYTAAHWAHPFPGSTGLVGLLDLALLLRHTGLPNLDNYDFEAPQRAWLRRALGVACGVLPSFAVLESPAPAAGAEAWRWWRLIRIGKRYIVDGEPFGRWLSPTMAAYRWQALMDTPSNALALMRDPWWCLFPPRATGRFNPRRLYSRTSRLWREEL